MRTMEDVVRDNYGYIPRPMDQLYNISIFQDYIPGLPQYRYICYSIGHKVYQGLQEVHDICHQILVCLIIDV